MPSPLNTGFRFTHKKSVTFYMFAVLLLFTGALHVTWPFPSARDCWQCTSCISRQASFPESESPNIMQRRNFKGHTKSDLRPCLGNFCTQLCTNIHHSLVILSGALFSLRNGESLKNYVIIYALTMKRHCSHVILWAGESCSFDKL